MAVCFWYLVKSDLSSVHAYSGVHWTSPFFTMYQKNTAMFIWSGCIYLFLFFLGTFLFSGILQYQLNKHSFGFLFSGFLVFQYEFFSVWFILEFSDFSLCSFPGRRFKQRKLLLEIRRQVCNFSYNRSDQ